jgi:glycosyltransferase involved in cell wall biosynthesis
MAPDITIFVSCYNERSSVVPTIEAVWSALSRCGLGGEFLVIDDCSQDDSVQMVQEFIGSHPNVPVRLVRHTANRGLAYSIFEAARLARGRYFWCVAGDNPVPEETCATLLVHVGKADIIIPYVMRYEGRSAVRRVLSGSYGILVRLASGSRIKYFNGSSIYLREQFLKHTDIPASFAYSAEMLITLVSEGASYVEVPVLYNERSSGKSTALSLRNFFDIAGLFGRLLWRRVGFKSPALAERKLLSDRN